MKSVVRHNNELKCFKLSPSDLVFLWEECPRCFYLKVACNIKRPWSPMPKVFTNIDLLMKVRFHGRRVEGIAPGMPAGTLDLGEKWVESKPIHIPSRSATCFIRGRFDLAAALDDRTFGVLDLKTAERRAEHLPLYARQLHAYAHALERPAPGKLSLHPVTKLGLLVYEPEGFSDNLGLGLLLGKLNWIEIPRDDVGFIGFLSDVLSVLEQPSPPPADPSCEWCKYRFDSEKGTAVSNVWSNRS